MPTLFDPAIPEAAHPGSDTDRLYAVQGSGAGRDRYIKRLDLFVDQMPNWAGSLGTPAHDTSNVFDLTSRVLVLDKDGAPKKVPSDFVGVRGYRVPITGTYAMKWEGSTGVGSSVDAAVTVITGAVASARTGITMSTLYPASSGMYNACFGGMAAGDAISIVSSARQVELAIAIDNASTAADGQIATFFATSLASLLPLSLSDKFPVDCIASNPDAGTFERLHGQLVGSSTLLTLKFFKASGAQYLYSDLHTLRGASSFVFLRFAMSSVV